MRGSSGRAEVVPSTQECRKMVQELHWLAVGLEATLKQSKPHFPQLARKRGQQRAGIFLVQQFTGQPRKAAFGYSGAAQDAGKHAICFY